MLEVQDIAVKERVQARVECGIVTVESLKVNKCSQVLSQTALTGCILS